MDYAIIGDSHECVNELSRLVKRLETEIPSVQIIHVGDYVDKGQNTEASIRFMWGRVFFCGDEVTMGNHERFVQGRLSGELAALDDPVKEASVFGSQEVILGDHELTELFFDLWRNSQPYKWLQAPGDEDGGCIVTHAPCTEESLGGNDATSIACQMNYRTKDRTIPTVEDLKWFYEEADESNPLHIFGHMAHSGKSLAECQYKNKIFLDTGCVYGNGLSAVHIRDGKVVGYYFEPSEGNRQPHATLPSPLGLR